MYSKHKTKNEHTAINYSDGNPGPAPERRGEPMCCDVGVTPTESMPQTIIQRASHFISWVPKSFSELEI